MNISVSPIVLVAIAGTACAPAAPTFTDADKAAIMAQRQAFVAAANAGDWDNAAAVYADDAVGMLANQPAIVGRPGIRRAFASFPPFRDFTLYGEEMIGSGDLAVVRGAFSMLLMPPGATTPVADTSKYVEVWRRQADGSWRLVWDIANSDRPQEAPPAAGK